MTAYSIEGSVLDPHLAIHVIIDMIPHWFEAKEGPLAVPLPFAPALANCFSHVPISEMMEKFLEEVDRSLPDLAKRCAGFSESLSIELLQDHYALKWLELHAPRIHWRRILDYDQEASRRTYENEPIRFHMLISSGCGRSDLLAQKTNGIDPLTNAPNTLLRIDETLRFMGYESVTFAMTDENVPGWCPNSLAPYRAMMLEDEWSVHRTPTGDFIVMNGGAIIAAKHENRWKLYDTPSLRGMLASLLGSEQLGLRTLELALDISFRRRGALLVYDPTDVLSAHVTNPRSYFVRDDQTASIHDALTPSLRPLSLAALDYSRANNDLLAGAASLDGALLYDDNHILAIGAMVRTHEDVKAQLGARTLAAISAHRHGATPIKVSSDGDITLYFTPAADQNVEARIELL